MIFYKHFIGDYQRDTGHLSILEHGAYRLLMDTCYATEKPLPTDERRIFRLLRATEPEEQEAIRTVLEEFWELGPDGWVNKRANREIAAQHERSEKARESARIRHSKVGRTANARANASETQDRDDCERSASHSQTPKPKPKPKPEPEKVSDARARASPDHTHALNEGGEKTGKPPTEDQLTFIRSLCRQRDIGMQDVATATEAAELIDDLKAGKMPERAASAEAVPVEPHPSNFGRCGRCHSQPVRRNAMGLCANCVDWIAGANGEGLQETAA